MPAQGHYHCAIKSVGRAKGRSIVAAAAYRAGERLTDARTGLDYDFSRRRGVIDSFIAVPSDAPDWARDRGQLWSRAEAAEKRANGRLATEFELALPHELSPEQRREVVAGYAQALADRYEVAVDVAIHRPGRGGDHRNFHAHLLVSHRELGPDGFGEIANAHIITRKVKGRFREVKVAGIANKSDIEPHRRDWADAVNQAYADHGLDIAVDHRSHEDRGMDAEPTLHLGPAASAMERRGERSRIGDANRAIDARNADRRELRAEAERVSAEIIDLDKERLRRSPLARLGAMRAGMVVQEMDALARFRENSARLEELRRGGGEHGSGMEKEQHKGAKLQPDIRRLQTTRAREDDRGPSR